MHSDDPIARALPAALDPLVRKLKKKLRQAQHGDPDGVHDARTLLRRIRVALGVMAGTGFEVPWAEKLARRVRDVERALGATRDDDVFLDDLDRWLKGIHGRSKSEAQPLRDRVRARRSKHARRAARTLGTRRARRTMRELQSFLKDPARRALPPPGNPARAARTLVRHIVHDQTWLAYEEALAYEVRRSPDVDVMHKFRSACRRLRFTLELFEGATHDSGRVIEALHALQTRLGDLHDHAIAAARLEKWLTARRLPETAPIREYLATQIRARDRLAAEFEGERRAALAQPFRAALFATLNGAEAVRAVHAPLRLVPGVGRVGGGRVAVGSKA